MGYELDKYSDGKELEICYTYAVKLMLDLHGYTEQDAYLRMQDFFSQLPKECREVTVVHGFRGGQVLKDMVQGFRHERIWSKQAGVLNPGQTIIFTCA